MRANNIELNGGESVMYTLEDKEKLKEILANKRKVNIEQNTQALKSNLTRKLHVLNALMSVVKRNI